MKIWRAFLHWLGLRSTLRLLFVVNFLGTIYGYYWYKNQLASTDLHLWPFVPDSPTASLFFTMVLFAFLLGKRWPFIEALASITLFKYGIWATVMILWAAYHGAPMYWEHYLLVFSHMGMAIQAVLYSPYYSFRIRHLLLAGAWTLLNDTMDYTLGIFPWISSRLHPYLTIVTIFTVSLSLFSLLLVYTLVLRNKKMKIDPFEV